MLALASAKIGNFVIPESYFYAEKFFGGFAVVQIEEKVFIFAIR
jgi:hypothetical protein